MKHKLQLFILLLFSLLIAIGTPTYLLAQSSSDTFRLDSVVANIDFKALDMYITAYDGANTNFLEQGAAPFAVFEQIGGGQKQELVIEKARANSDQESANNGNVELTTKPLTILFLLDVSGSMTGNNARQAKKAIENVVKGVEQADLQFSWFHNDIRPTLPINSSNLNQVFKEIDTELIENLDTDLYRALKDKADELREKTGDKVLILITDGKNDNARNPYYKKQNVSRITESEILSHVGNLGNDFRIFPIGIGGKADAAFLQKVANQTPDTTDYYRAEQAPEDLAPTVIKLIKNLKSNIILQVRPKEETAVYGAEKRTWHVTYKQGNKDLTSNLHNASLGSATKSIDLQRKRTSDIGMVLLWGLIIITALLMILWFLVPMVQNFFFKKNYVRRYGDVKQANLTRYDPITTEPFEDEDMVVVMENSMMSVESWHDVMNDGEGALTGKYSKFFDKHTQGHFFQQSGMYQRLNWLWFGAFGGFLALCLDTLFTWLGLDTSAASLFAFLNEQGSHVANSIGVELVTGMAIGTAIGTTIAIVEELGQSRGFSFGRILLRMLIAFIASIFIFTLEGILVAKVVPIRYLGDLVGWTLFGTALGWVVSIKSTIEWKRGVLGGLIAGLIAFHIYFLIKSIGLDSKWARLLGFISYGGILGLILFVIIKRLEDFELLYLAPQYVRGQTKAISKWLKSPAYEHIFLGTSPKCEVRIKWNDIYVEARHAKMSYKHQTVYIETVGEANTLVNDVVIRQRTPLENGDRIQLGRQSKTIMEFKAKESIGPAQRGGDNDSKPPKEIPLEDQIIISKKGGY